METITDNSRVIKIIEDCVSTDMLFKDFCVMLEVKQSRYVQLAAGRDRAYHALREYAKSYHTVDEFLSTCLGHGWGAMVGRIRAALGAPSSRPAADIGALRVEIYNLLTPSDKQNILLGIGCPPGVAASCAGSITEFWSRIQQRDMTTGPGLSAAPFGSYPVIREMIFRFNRGETAGSASSATSYSSSASSATSYSDTAPANAIASANNQMDEDDNPFHFEKREETMRGFVAEDGQVYRALCVIMNRAGVWKSLANHYGALGRDPARAAKLLADLARVWEQTRANNPSHEILTLLAKTPIGERGLDKFLADLAALDCPELKAAADEHIAFRRAGAAAVVDASREVYVANVELRDFLLKHKVSSPTTVDGHIAILTSPAVEVATPEDLKTLSAAQLEKLGFSMVAAARMVAAVAKA